VKEAVLSYIKNNKCTVVTTAVLYILSVMLRLAIQGGLGSALVLALLNTAILFLLINLFAKTKIRILVVFLVAFFLSVDITTLYIVGSPMNMGIMASVFETNEGEIYSMSKVLLLPFVVLFVAFFFLLYKSTSEMKRTKRVNIAFSISFIVFFMFVMPIVRMGRTQENGMLVAFDMIKISPSVFYAHVTALRYPLVVADPFIAWAYFDEMAKIKSEANKTKQLPEGVVYSGNEMSPDKIILVIGESSYWRHYSLYGYDLKTTPFLDSLSVDSSRFNYYKDVISPAAFTREAIKLTLSFATVWDNRPFFDEMNMINMAENAGYETYWITSSSKGIALNAGYVNIIAAGAGTVYNQSGYEKDDLNLISVFKSHLKPAVKQFFVLHLLGSHMDYKGKYDSIDTQALGSVGETIDYDKTIHHTDRFLREVFNTVKDSDDNTVVYYYPDHGEVVNVGHPVLNKGKSQFEIPLVVMQNKHTMDIDDIVLKYYDEETGRLNVSGNIYILGEIMGYKVSDNWIEKSKKDGRFVFQPDGSVVPYIDIAD